jgi:hypothetical protein
MIANIFDNNVTVVTVTSEDNLKRLRNTVLNKSPGIMIIESPKKHVFPKKFTLVYNRKLLSCTMLEIEKEYTV